MISFVRIAGKELSIRNQQGRVLDPPLRHQHKGNYMKSRLLVIFIILTLSLSACVSLAEDITPPPDARQPAPEATEPPEAASANEAEPAEEIDGAALFSQA